jgi:LPS sulfotransferase NodH
LADTGIAGRPASFFRPQTIADWVKGQGAAAASDPDPLAFDRAYLGAVLRYGADRTGAFGFRIMWENLDDLSRRLQSLYPALPDDAARLSAAFGTTHYVHLTRTDKLAQAVSLVRALQTGLWHVHADGREREREGEPRPATYDAAELAGKVADLERHDASWLRWFERNRIRPIRVTYESLSHDPIAALSDLLSALGLDPSVATGVQPGTKKLADAESGDWMARFRQSARPR